MKKLRIQIDRAFLNMLNNQQELSSKGNMTLSFTFDHDKPLGKLFLMAGEAGGIEFQLPAKFETFYVPLEDSVLYGETNA
jgi:hypothetical protein